MLVGYGRVSTRDQNLETQQAALVRAGCEKIFIETASGAQRDRKELHAAISYMRAGDVLVVWKLDRLARSLKQLLETVEHLNGNGIGFRSITESIDTTTPAGTFVLQVFGALAEFERELIRERTIAGLDHARAQGRIGGRPRRLTENKILSAKALLADGKLTVAEVAAEVGVSESTLYRHIKGGRSSLHS